MNKQRLITWFLVGSVLIVALLPGGRVTPAAAQTISPFDLRTNPLYLIASYYNAITLRDYTRAYNYWEGHPPANATYAQFVQGFTGVQSVRALARLPLTVEGAAGTLYVSVPVVLLSTLQTGAQQIFAGCFQLSKPNMPVGNPPVIDSNWHLNSAVLSAATSVDFVQAVNACTRVESFPTAGQIENRTTPIDLINSYYDAIAAKNYTRAFNYWQGGAPGQTFAQFSQGFAATSEIGVIVALDFQIGAAGGSTYAASPLLILSKANGVQQYFVGCVVARQSNVPAGNPPVIDPNWYLYNANTYAVTSRDVALQHVWTVCAP